jgi:hypothetical protein
MRFGGVIVDWLDDYLDYTSPQEAPEIFHFWSGCAIIASVLNRRVWMSRRAPTGVVYYENYPGQLSPMLIAGSGKAKKSTAINIAKSFMKEAGVKVYDGKITPEQLLAKLAGMEKQFGAAILTAVASELSGFLGKQSYNDGLIDILIKLADCEAHPYETRQNTFPLTTVCFTLFSGSTPIGLSKAIPPQAQEHGFLSRYPWIYSDKSGKIESLANDEEDVDVALLRSSTEKRRSLVVRLRGFTQLAGSFRWGSARGWFREYYENYSRSPISEGEGWPTRRADHLVRLAMVLNVSRGCQSKVFSVEDLSRADKYLAEIERDMPKCFAFIGQHVNAESQERILKVFREKGLNQTIRLPDLFYRVGRYFPDTSALKSQMTLLEEAGVLGYVGRVNNVAIWTMLKEPY